MESELDIIWTKKSGEEPTRSCTLLYTPGEVLRAVKEMQSTLWTAGKSEKIWLD